jgi:hypothetical protein
MGTSSNDADDSGMELVSWVRGSWGHRMSANDLETG